MNTADSIPSNALLAKAGTVLLVEDEEFLLNLLRKILENSGYEVLPSPNPREGIVLAERCTSPIDLLITDIMMPEMNGLELYQRLESMRPGLKCLYMSGYAEDYIAELCFDGERAHFIQKPFSMKALTAKISGILNDDESVHIDPIPYSPYYCSGD